MLAPAAGGGQRTLTGFLSRLPTALLLCGVLHLSAAGPAMAGGTVIANPEGPDRPVSSPAQPGSGQVAPGERPPLAIPPPGRLLVTGRVADPQGRPVAEARVSVPRSTAPVPEMTFLTDAAGVYVWSLPAGTFTLAVFADGYRPATAELTSAGGEIIQIDFTLERE